MARTSMPRALLFFLAIAAAAAAGHEVADTAAKPASSPSLRGTRSERDSAAVAEASNASSTVAAAAPAESEPTTAAGEEFGLNGSAAASATEALANASSSLESLGAVSGGSCLCLFDVDRTLTGKQGSGAPVCPGNSVRRGVYDDAYGGGDLTLSQLGQNVRGTACGGCRLGVVSAGSAGGGAMKATISGALGVENSWSYAGGVHSPLVLSCGDKPACARDVMGWYNQRGADLKPSDVYVFDDKGSNIASFYGTDFNAQQVSCASRDGSIGRCGAKTSEVQLSRGVHMC